MSYILDALKKKDDEERNSAVPDLTSQHQYSQFEESTSRPNTLLILLSLIGVLLLALLVVMLLNNSNSSTEENALVASPQEPATQAVEESGASQKAVTEKNNSQEISKQDSGFQVVQASIEKPALVLEKVVPARTQQQTSFNQEVVSKPLAVEASEPLTNVQTSQNDYSAPQTTQGENADLPKLIYTTHVYASEQKDRFVMLNGKAYSVGGKLSRNFYIKDILENDLLLSYKGQEYLVPALTDVNP